MKYFYGMPCCSAHPMSTIKAGSLCACSLQKEIKRYKSYKFNKIIICFCLEIWNKKRQKHQQSGADPHKTDTKMSATSLYFWRSVWSKNHLVARFGSFWIEFSCGVADEEKIWEMYVKYLKTRASHCIYFPFWFSFIH